MDITGNFLSNEKIDARIQILDAGGSLLLDADTTVRVSGGWSRQSAQMKNLHLKLQDGAVSGILSAAPGGDALDTLVLRGQRKRGAYTGLHQDAFLNNYCTAWTWAASTTSRVVLYLETSTGASTPSAKAKTPISSCATTALRRTT